MTPIHDQFHRYEINLDRSRAPRAFRDEQNLWRDDIRRIHRLIHHHVQALILWEKARTTRNDRATLTSDDRPHLAIAIFGPSGSGKSSLIRTLADDVRRPHGQILHPDLDKKVETLPVMDPTTWAPSDQFLYAFLASALEEERKHQERKEHGYPQGLSPVQLAFQEVNEYLRVVDEPERSEEHDPLGLSLQKLERHTSGLRLRQALGTLIEELSKEFHSQVVLLPVDDLDMAPDHLVEALQSYQSYLTHPRLVPIFTFTDRMPEELIEVYYQSQMGQAASHRRLGGTNRLSISEQMAVQFLARCFPVRNRIRLGPAPARVQRAVYRSSAMDESSADHHAPVFELLVQASFLLFGHHDNEDSHMIRASLRPSTLRRQFQVVDAMSDCRISALRTPQIAALAGAGAERIQAIAQSIEKELATFPSYRGMASREVDEGGSTDTAARDAWERWRQSRKWRRSLSEVNMQDSLQLRGEHEYGYQVLARQLWELRAGATWASLFNGATWSLLNVHRDTLRELGLFLEDLYSWSPKELRSVVLQNLLDQSQVTRRTVLDRWFNRTDYRRSQVLSLLAANVFRPWMPGEEPYGDEDRAIREQLELEREMNSVEDFAHPLDGPWPGPSQAGSSGASGSEAGKVRHQIEQRLTIPAPAGVLWFLDLTMGFYLPQVMARNWDQAVDGDVPVKSRMGGNGWDLHHAATNAVRMADARQEVFSFGMIFLNPTAYRQALEIPHSTEDVETWPNTAGGHAPIEENEVWERFRQRGTDARSQRQMLRRHLLLRIWTCSGYSRGRFWAGFSLWRGLSFVGQVIEIGLRFSSLLRRQTEASRSPGAEPLGYLAAWQDQKRRDIEDPQAGSEDLHAQLLAEMPELAHELFRLVRRHCLQGLVPGSLLSQNSSDEKLLQGYVKWDPREPLVEKAIHRLVEDLIAWLIECWDDLIYPLPAGTIWLGWKGCFLRRVHGEYILGGLWPRLNATYLERQGRKKHWGTLAAHRATGQAPGNMERAEDEPESEKFRWTASLAAGAWSDVLLEYWRGCPPVLKLLLTCPVLFRSNERFGWVDGSPDPPVDGKELRRKFEEELGDASEEGAERDPREDATRKRFYWLRRLGLSSETWKQILDFWTHDHGGSGWNLVPSELAIPRVQTQQFQSYDLRHHAVRLEQSRLDVELDVSALAKKGGAVTATPKQRISGSASTRAVFAAPESED